MLIKIPLLSFLIFGITYPLCFWLTAKDPIKNNFHRFHIACPLIIAGLAIICLWGLPLEQTLKNLSGLWFVAFFLLTGFYWNKETVSPLAVSVIVLWGLKLFEVVYIHLVGPDMTGTLVSILAGLIVSVTFYAMNLGHFYLNVHGLNIKHLKIATLVYATLLAIRLLWDIFYIATAKMMYGGEEVGLMHFMTTIDGFLLWVAIFFGTIFALGASYFAFGTLKLKNTQATTGILYVLLSAVLLGDLAYKYYLLKFHIPL